MKEQNLKLQAKPSLFSHILVLLSIHLLFLIAGSPTSAESTPENPSNGDSLEAQRASLPGGAGTPLPIAEGCWVRILYSDGLPLFSEEEAAGLRIETDPQHGPCLAIGPWHRGKWRAQLESAGKVSSRTGTIRGLYRTVNLMPGEAYVSISFFGPGGRIYRSGYNLAPSDEWAPFSIPIRHAPPGTDSLSFGFGLNKRTAGKVYFTRLSFDTGLPPLAAPEQSSQPDRTKPKDRFQQSGSFGLNQDSTGFWWLVTPEGEPFFSSATVAPSFEGSETGNLTGLVYEKMIREMGFNSLAGWTSLESWSRLNDQLEKRGKPALPLFFAMESNDLGGSFDYLVDQTGRRNAEGGHAFPDPFDPRFSEAYRKDFRKVAERVRGKPWFIGWFADNELSHESLSRHVYSKHCRAAFTSWLMARYGELKSLNASWGTTFRSADELTARLPSPGPRDTRMHADFLEFEAVIVKRYADVVLEIIRSEDPDHLVFSPRFMLSDSSCWLQHLESYKRFDGMAINLYPSNLQLGLTRNERALLQLVHQRTGKPLVISEWSVPALDSGLYSDPKNLDWSYAEALLTQDERAKQVFSVMSDFYSLPFVVGAHWFRWEDYDTPDRKSNRGLVKEGGGNWKEVQESFQAIHKGLR